MYEGGSGNGCRCDGKNAERVRGEAEEIIGWARNQMGSM